jgi:diguanylate cyclase (GGDEF)-like protein
MVDLNIMDTIITTDESGKLKEELSKLKAELDKTKNELGILYEVSNAMRTTLKLDEISYIILTGVTAHIGLSFNRALLFLHNEFHNIIEGRMGIGPESGEEANQIWTQIEQEKMNLEDLISVYKFSNSAMDSKFSRQVRSLKFSLSDHNNLLSMAFADGMPLHLTPETISKYQNDPVIQTLKTHELIIVPLKSKEKVNGLILADNLITQKPITKDNIRMLTMLANQAGLAIENSQLFEKTVIRSHSDHLTELWNHGYFQTLLLQELDRSKATLLPLTLIIMDIDDFKVYNDTLGHQAGDRILKDLARILRNQSRKMDFVCRYGGEEFAILLPHTEKKEAYVIAERLRVDIEKHQFLREEILPNKKLTVSMGLSSFPANGMTPSELIASADKALYKAKNHGKNATCCA